ncbi:MAG: hypothetical protein OWR62_09395 [Sulfobacillus thermotolerans]|jgi:hypothetical protein|nr:hypothetical protein [Sulfobacillus thermotolerans]
MTTLLTRVWWMFVALLMLFGTLFFALYGHMANQLAAAAKRAASVAAITADTSAIDDAAEAGLPWFEPSTDIRVQTVHQDDMVQVSVTHNLSVFPVLTHVLGIPDTIPVTRVATEALDYPHNGLHALVTQAAPSPVAIHAVQLDEIGSQVHLYVEGYGFGPAPQGVPGTTMQAQFVFRDLTEGWFAGSPSSGLAITYAAWTPNEIEVTGIEDLNRGTERLNPGDVCQIQLRTASGQAVYDFVADPAGSTKDAVSIEASGTRVPTTDPVTLTATSSVSGNGVDGVGLYNATTGQTVAWSGAGDRVAALVSRGVGATEDYYAYYGPKSQVATALATSQNVAVTWVPPGPSVTAVMYLDPTSRGAVVDVYGPDIQSATVEGVGLSNPTVITNDDLALTAASASDDVGEVLWPNGTESSFTALEN